MKTLLVALFCLSVGVSAFGFGQGTEGCGSDCASCHKITKEEASALVSELDRSLTVDEVAPAPIRGLYQLMLKKDGNLATVVYVDFSKKHLIAGNIIDVSSKRNLTQRSFEEALVVDVKKIPVQNAVVMGNPKGTKNLYVFSDPECPFCVKLHHELEALVKEDPQVKVNVILNPLSIHPNAMWKSQSIICKSKESMPEALKMLEASYEKKDVPKLTCGKNAAEENSKIAASLGLGTTPTTVLPNGKIIIGAKKKDELKAALEQALKEKK